MDTFNFPYHLWSEEYPESSFKAQFGGGYEFASAPNAPDQVIYVLQFPGMWFFKLPNGQLDLTTQPLRNIGLLRKFYQDHRLYDYFLYPHPIDGNVRVRFKDPFVLPKGVPAGRGLVEPFEIKLRLQP